MRTALALLVLLGSLSVSGSWFDEVTALAEQGGAIAHLDLALTYDRGMENPQNYKEAVRWFRASVEQRHAAG